LKIAIIGIGYVGIVTTMDLAEMKHTVIGTDVIAEKIDMASKKIPPIYEPGLEELL